MSDCKYCRAIEGKGTEESTVVYPSILGEFAKALDALDTIQASAPNGSELETIAREMYSTLAVFVNGTAVKENPWI